MSHRLNALEAYQSEPLMIDLNNVTEKDIVEVETDAFNTGWREALNTLQRLPPDLENIEEFTHALNEVESIFFD